MSPTPEQERVAGALVALAGWLVWHGDQLVWPMFALAVMAVGGVLAFRVADALATLRLKRRGGDALAAWLHALRGRAPDGRSHLYHAYMVSPQWAARSQGTITLAGGVCQRCVRRKATQAHHLTYERFIREWDSDLLAVCKRCHDELHGR